MKFKVKEVADLVGISVRTLHHYDDIGLLTPDETTDSGYRLYSEENLEILQQILFFRELDFPLSKIKEVINNPSFNREEALQFHRQLLMEKRERINIMIATIDKTLLHMKGEFTMSNKEKFEGFDFSQNPYEDEARKRWGDETVNRSNAALGSLTEDEQKAMGEKMNAIYHKLAELKEGSPQSEEAQVAIKQWYDILNQLMGQKCSLEAFKQIGQMYVDDERFTKNIDQFGVGLAQFMSEAMAYYADTNN